MSEKYREAGVDLEAATESVSRLVPLVKRTHRAGVLGNLGGFGGLFSLRDAGFTSEGGPEELILVSGTDGVGTKLELAISQEKVDTIGIDGEVVLCAESQSEPEGVQGHLIVPRNEAHANKLPL